MDAGFTGFRRGYVVVFLSLVVGTAGAAQMQKATRRGESAPSYTSGFDQPQLINAETEPTLHYPIASLPGMTCASVVYGWLDISRGHVQFKVVQPPNKMEDSFEAAPAELSEVKIWQTSVKFRIGPKKHVIFYVPESNWGSIHNCPAYFAAESLGEKGTFSIYNAFQNFGTVLAQAKAAAAPPPPAVTPPVESPVTPEPKPAPSEPPALVLTAPSGAAPNQVVDASDSPLTVRGVAMDSAGIPVIKINGVPSNMRPQSNQAAEFWSEPLALHPGENPIEIVASNAAHLETKLTFTVRYAPKTVPVSPKGLGKEEIISLLQGEVPGERIAELVKERGLKFSPTEDDFSQMRAAGATDDLVQAIRQAASHP